MCLWFPPSPSHSSSYDDVELNFITPVVWSTCRLTSSFNQKKEKHYCAQSIIMDAIRLMHSMPLFGSWSISNWLCCTDLTIYSLLIECGLTLTASTILFFTCNVAFSTFTLTVVYAWLQVWSMHAVKMFLKWIYGSWMFPLAMVWGPADPQLIPV